MRKALIMIIFRVSGTDDVIKDLNKLDKAAMYKAMRATAVYAVSLVPPYPPARPGWRRTLRLGRSITSKVTAEQDKIHGYVIAGGEKVKYAPWVVSSEKVGNSGPQRWYHKLHGWWTLQGVVRDNKSKIINFLAHAIKNRL